MTWNRVDGSLQDCSNSSALAMELLQSSIEPSIYSKQYHLDESLKVLV